MNTIVVNNISLGYHHSLGAGEAIYPTFSITTHSSELIALVGRNGVGKSTFLRTLVGLQKPLSGNVHLIERDINNYTQRKLASVISFVSTENIRISNLKVFDLVALGRYPYTDWFGSLVREDKAKVIEALDMVGIRHLMWRDVAQLSDGELQRAAIARTLAQDTPIIVLDEPMAFLDLPNKYEILLLLRKLTRQKNKTVILSTHDLGIAMRLVDKIWLMAGEGLLQGAPEDLAIQGAYDKLFVNTFLSFNHQQGTVDLGIEPNVEIYLKTTTETYWVKRALERMGFAVKNEKTTHNMHQVEVKVCGNDGGMQIIYTSGGMQKEFTDLYSFGRYVLPYLTEK